MVSRKVIVSAALAGGFTGYAVYSYQNRINNSAGQTSNIIKLNTLTELPKITANRQVKGLIAIPGNELTLFQYTNCPFSSKVRTFLDYYGFTYNVVDVSPFKKSSQLKFSPFKKIPLVVASHENDHQLLTDSSAIISVLASCLMREPSPPISEISKLYEVRAGKVVKTSSGAIVRAVNYDVNNKYFCMYGESISEDSKADELYQKIKEEAKWREWADSSLARLIVPNIYQTVSEAHRSVQCFAQAGQWDQQFSFVTHFIMIYPGTLALYLLGKLQTFRHKLNRDVRQELFKACHQWVKAIGKNQLFMGGSQPNLADLAVYGVLSSIEGCDAFKDIMTRTDIKGWYYRVQGLVNNHAGSKLVSQKFHITSSSNS